MQFHPQVAQGQENRTKLEKRMDTAATAIWVGEKIFFWVPWTIGAFVIIRKGFKFALWCRDLSIKAGEVVATKA
jgi:hypothetical protein